MSVHSGLAFKVLITRNLIRAFIDLICQILISPWVRWGNLRLQTFFQAYALFQAKNIKKQESSMRIIVSHKFELTTLINHHCSPQTNPKGDFKQWCFCVLFWSYIRDTLLKKAKGRNQCPTIRISAEEGCDVLSMALAHLTKGTFLKLGYAGLNKKLIPKVFQHPDLW